MVEIFTGRTGRKDYFLYGVLPFWLVLLFTFFYPIPANNEDLSFIQSLVGLLLFIILPALVILTIRRFNDMGKRWYYIFLFLLPFGFLVVGIWLLLGESYVEKDESIQDNKNNTLS